MDILIAEDDLVSRRLLEATLQKWGHVVRVAADGTAAWEVLSAEAPPPLVILDWMMPGLDGPTLCRRIRETPRLAGSYVILLTARAERQDVVAGLDSGADDYITKPFDREDLRARVNVGLRVLGLQKTLAERVRELEQALQRVQQLQGLLPICCYCKRIRDDSNYWQQVEEYLAACSGAQFTHGICPQCFETIVQAQLRAHRPHTETSTSEPDASPVI
jgi:sigma-B regulation protein RsbU (phosphoserine phosphatase)